MDGFDPSGIEKTDTYFLSTVLASSVYFVAALAFLLSIGAMRKRGTGFLIHPGALSLLSMVLFYIVAVSSFNVVAEP